MEAIINNTKIESEYVAEHIAQRAQNPNFVMVEIGHGCFPACENDDFTDDRAYVGIEANLRNNATIPKPPHRQNWFFIDTDTKVQLSTHEYDRYTINPHDYDPSSILPDDSADEVFLSNVLTDRIVAYNFLAKLVPELARIVTKNGVIVTRETYTPKVKLFKFEQLLAINNLVLAQTINFNVNPDSFMDLERTYFGHSINIAEKPESYYQFINSDK